MRTLLTTNRRPPPVVTTKGECHDGEHFDAASGLGSSRARAGGPAVRRALSFGTRERHAAPRPAPARAAPPLPLSFEKAAVGAGVWQGTVSGDVDGDLTTLLTACTGCSGGILHVEVDWIIPPGAAWLTP